MSFFKPVFLIVGVVLIILSALMILPAVLLTFDDHPNRQAFALSAALTFLCGALMASTCRGTFHRFRSSQLFLITVSCWVWGRPSRRCRGFSAIPPCRSPTRYSKRYRVLPPPVIAFAVESGLPKGNVSLIYLTAVLIVAVRTSTRPALFCAGISFLVYNFFFTEPRLTLFMMHREDVLTVGFYLLLAALTGHLAARLREQVVALRGREAINQAQFLLSEHFSAAIDKREIGEALCDALKNVFAKTCFVLDIESSKNGCRLTPLCGDIDPPETVRSAAARLLENDRAATVSDDGQYYLKTMHDHRGPAAVLGLAFQDDPTTGAEERKSIVDAFVKQAALALGRTRLVNELQGERLEKERELLRSALLSSISHDLRTPLSAMMQHAGRLVTQQLLLRELWGPHHVKDTHYLRIVVARLRSKLRDDAANPRYLETEPGVGYRFIPEPGKG